MGPGQIEKYASMPCSRTASAPGPIEPARASDGTIERASDCATPTAVLPKALWASIAPSPVKHRSAFSSRSASLTALMISVDAGLELAAGESNQSPAQPAGGAEPG